MREKTFDTSQPRRRREVVRTKHRAEHERLGLSRRERLTLAVVIAVLVSWVPGLQAQSELTEDARLATTYFEPNTVVSVALEGDRAIIGAFEPSLVRVGETFVYERNSSGPWTETARLVPSSGDDSTLFGSSVTVALSGDRAVVTSMTGQVHVFERDSSSTWTEVATLIASDRPEMNWFADGFGESVAISGDRIIVGANSQDTASGREAGSAYFYERGSSGIWTEVAKVIAAGSTAGNFSYFGTAVSIVGDRAIVGAPFEAAGAVYVYERDSSGVWA